MRPVHGGVLKILDRCEELLLGDGPAGLPALGAAYAREDGPPDLVLLAELPDLKEPRSFRFLRPRCLCSCGADVAYSPSINSFPSFLVMDSTATSETFAKSVSL